MKKQYYFIIFGIVVIIIFVSTVANLEITTIERPWSNLSCDEKIQLALSPQHQDYSDEQHIEFHKDVEICMKGMSMQHGN
jgi:hypothetical protein